jgi:hypothetical protein
MAFPAFLDTCVLYPSYLCDTLLRLAEKEIYRPLWSRDVMTELRRNLIKQGLPADRVDRRSTRSLSGAHGPCPDAAGGRASPRAEDRAGIAGQA